MTSKQKPEGVAATPDPADSRFATLTFQRQVASPLPTLWQAWTAPAARAVWSAPTPSSIVEFLEADTSVGGREVSICKADDQPIIRCECGWLELQPARRSVNYEVVSSEGATRSAALVTAEFSGTNEYSRLVVTVQLSSSGEDMAAGYRQGFNAGLDNLAEMAKRTPVELRKIQRQVGYRCLGAAHIRGLANAVARTIRTRAAFHHIGRHPLQPGLYHPMPARGGKNIRAIHAGLHTTDQSGAGNDGSRLPCRCGGDDDGGKQ
ncbi:MAG: SRPBCC domain-containing protein [Pigmentiphaga sp.]